MLFSLLSRTKGSFVSSRALIGLRTLSTSELTTVEALKLTELGISTPAPVYRNLSYEDIAEHEEKCKFLCIIKHIFL